MKYKIPLALATLIAFSAPMLASANILTALEIGDSGPEVTELQTFLAANPTVYPEGLITGYFGSLTQAAVQRYQCNEGIVCSGTPTTTGYGRVGPITRSHINADMNGTGGVGGSNDVNAPLMFGSTIATSQTSATLSWSTSEDAFGKVMYATSWPFLYATAPSFSSTGFDTVHTVTLTGLTPNTTYYFVRESVDAAGNVQWSFAETFTTK